MTTPSASAAQPITTPERNLLAILKKLAAPTLRTTDFAKNLQEVKSALYEKDYARAFGSEEYRFAYALRWVPSRAVIYRRIFKEIGGGRTLQRTLMGSAAAAAEAKEKGETVVRKAIMLGGGAGSEVIGLAAFLGEQEEDLWATGKVDVLAVDQSDWSSVLKQQEEALLAGYPSLGDRFSVNFQLANILDATATSTIPFATASVITLLFTISELFLQSRSATLSLLSTITAQARPGTLLIIVESASLGLIPIGTSGNTYPLGMLLDSALTQTKGRAEEDRAKWEILQEEENKWYRMPNGSEECYPLKLENSRVVSRVLRKL